MRRLRNNAFLRMASAQLAADARRAPRTVRGRLTEAGKACRYAGLADIRAAARRALPRPVFDFVDGAAGEEVTATRNRAAFGALELRPRVLCDVTAVSTATTVLGESVAVPVLGAPHGAGLLLHPAGEAGIARALYAAGSIYVVSSMASQSIEELAAATPGGRWMQMYVWRDRGLTRELLWRARDAGGYTALVVTVDTPRVGLRERDVRNGFTLPPRITLRALAGGLAHPRWAARFVASPGVGLANLAGGPGSQPVDLSHYARAVFDAALGWHDVAWLREQWPGPIVLKGILTGEDAARAVRVGVDAVVVSNHGGRQLDHVPPAIAALPEVVDAAGGDMEVLVDGGIRRGTDVVKALALGARACLVGRPVIFGLAAAGQAGAARAVELLRVELELTLALLGCRSIADLDGSYVAAADSAASRVRRSASRAR